MTWKARKPEKYCLTCANWAGSRRVHFSWAETDTPGTRGKCYCGVGCVTPGPQACDGHQCSKYTPWAALE